jgi:hypothetical protein
MTVSLQATRHFSLTTHSLTPTSTLNLSNLAAISSCNVTIEENSITRLPQTPLTRDRLEDVRLPSMMLEPPLDQIPAMCRAKIRHLY